MKKEFSKYILSVSVCFVAIAIVITATVVFLKKVDDVALSERIQYLTNVSQQSSDIIGSRLTNDLATVTTISEYLSGIDADITDGQVSKGVYNITSKSNNFENISIVKNDGNVLNPINGVPINIADRSYFNKMLADETVISDIIDARDDGMPVIVIASPIYSNETVIGGIVGRFSATKISKIIQSSISEKDVRCYVAHANGDTLGSTVPQNGEKRMSNVINDLKQAYPQNLQSMYKVKEDMKSLKKGYATITYMDELYLLNYMPIGINDLYCVSFMPFNKEITNIRYTTGAVIWSCCIILIILLLVLMIMLIQVQKKNIMYHKTSTDLDVIYKGVPNGMFRTTYDPSMKIVFANDKFYNMLSIDKKELEEKYDMCFAHFLGKAAENIFENSKNNETTSFERCVETAQGKKWFEISTMVTKNPDNDKSEIFCSIVNIDKAHDLADNLYIQEKYAQLILEQSNDVIFSWDYGQNEMYYSKNFKETFGYVPQIGEFPDGFIQLGIIYREDRQSFMNLFKAINMGSVYSEDELRIRRNDGGYLWCKMCIMAIRDSEKSLRKVICSITNIDTKKRDIGTISQEQASDSITSLLSKEATAEFIEETLRNANSGQCAYLMIKANNIDKAKEMFDEETVNKALKELAERIQALFRDGDIVGRVADDTFAVFMRNITGEQIADYKAKCVIQALEYTISNNEKSLAVTGNIGIVYTPKDAKTYTQLHSKAVQALAQATKQGPSTVAEYELTM